MSNNIRNRFSRHTEKDKKIEGESMAKQSFKEEADINTITNRYLRGQTPTIGNPRSNRKPMFGDFTAMEFQEMQNAVLDIHHDFEALPSRIRNKFKNDPYQLKRFLDDPANEAEAIKLGLLFVQPSDDEFVKDEPATQQLDLAKEAEKKPENPA